MLIAIIILVVLFLLMLLLGQLMYDTHRKIAYVIWGISVTLLIFFSYNYNNKNTQAGDKNSERFLGVYNIDIPNSNYDSIDVADYYDLTLTVKEDHSFSLSKESPFFTSRTGYWQHFDDGDVNWTEVSFEKGNLFNEEIDSEHWKFQGNNLKNGKNGNFIVFKR